MMHRKYSLSLEAPPQPAQQNEAMCLISPNNLKENGFRSLLDLTSNMKHRGRAILMHHRHRNQRQYTRLVSSRESKGSIHIPCNDTQEGELLPLPGDNSSREDDLDNMGHSSPADCGQNLAVVDFKQPTKQPKPSRNCISSKSILADSVTTTTTFACNNDRTPRKSALNRSQSKDVNAHDQLQQMQYGLEKMSQNASTGECTVPLAEDEETCNLLSDLKERNNLNEDMILRLQRQLIRVTNERNESLDNLQRKTAEVENWKRRCRRAEHELVEKKRGQYALIEKMASKMVRQLQTTSEDSETIRAEVVEWKDNFDDLIAKVGDLADENGKLAAKCSMLEEYKENCDSQLRELENDSKSMQLEANDWRDKYEKMGRFNIELLDKMEDVAEENGRLLVTCRQLKFLESKCANVNDGEDASASETHPARISKHVPRRASFVNAVLETPMTDIERGEVMTMIKELEAKDHTALHSP